MIADTKERDTELEKDQRRKGNLKLLMELFLHLHLQLQCLCNLVASVITDQCNKVSAVNTKDCLDNYGLHWIQELFRCMLVPHFGTVV